MSISLRAFLVVTMSVFCVAGGPQRAACQTGLADRLASLETAVLPAEERKAAANMVADAIRRRRQELSDQSTKAWQAIKNLDDWQRFRQTHLDALRTSLGDFPQKVKSLDVRITSSFAGDGFAIDNLIFQSKPGLWVTANLYRPAKPGPGMPGILICHAHHTPKGHGELQDMGMTWARAGCLVLIMDQLGHGERRQHPFVDAKSFAKPYRDTRQDYHFRYDNGIQLHLAGSSLMSWMAWDLMCGVDLLLAQKGADPKKIILLGSVAGGGDPAAVVAALDDRVACVVPFNFGGPSPKPIYPFDKEPVWNFAGSGSWESTRNLRDSTVGGFMPWVLVAAAAPRHLIYAHEFAWFREGDPVWKRLQTIYGFHNAEGRLAFTFGKGDVSKKAPEASHCTHIGATHRRLIHEALRRWFQIDVTPATEYRNRVPPEKLLCMTEQMQRELRPGKLKDMLDEQTRKKLAEVRLIHEREAGDRLKRLRAGWAKVLGNIEPAARIQADVKIDTMGEYRVERVLLETDTGIKVPVLLLLPPQKKGKKLSVVVAVCQAGKADLLRPRRAEIGKLLEAGRAVCLPDVRGTGETGLGSGRGHSSPATALSSSLLMLGETMVGNQLRDLRAVLAWLRTRHEIDAARLSLWGDSLTPPNPPGTNFILPRDDDAVLPRGPEPLGGMLVLLAGLFDERIDAIYAHGGLGEMRSVFDSHLVLMPHDVVLPGVLTVSDLPELTSCLAPRPLRLEGLVTANNLALTDEQIRRCYLQGAQAGLTVAAKFSSPARFFLEH